MAGAYFSCCHYKMRTNAWLCASAHAAQMLDTLFLSMPTFKRPRKNPIEYLFFPSSTVHTFIAKPNRNLCLWKVFTSFGFVDREHLFSVRSFSVGLSIFLLPPRCFSCRNVYLLFAVMLRGFFYSKIFMRILIQHPFVCGLYCDSYLDQ